VVEEDQVREVRGAEDRTSSNGGGVAISEISIPVGPPILVVIEAVIFASGSTTSPI
jgi:hypothetical protein